ncbi:hypothetical protein MMC34_000269 [Xylographa carneopallida]|nr:hypothetical protein [Xylographa carneopallida]
MGMSTFLAPVPTDLVNLTTLNSIEPTGIQSQFIPTLWNNAATSSSSTASAATSSSAPAGATTSAEASSSTSGSSTSNSTTIIVAVVVPVVVVLAIASIITFCWRRRVARRRQEATRGTYRVAETKSPALYNTDPNEIDGRAYAAEMAHGDMRTELPGRNPPVELS